MPCDRARDFGAGKHGTRQADSSCDRCGAVQCDFVEVADIAEGETLKLFPINERICSLPIAFALIV